MAVSLQYQDMHYAEFAEDEVGFPHVWTLRGHSRVQSLALREAIREYEVNKWKVIGQKVGKPAKVKSSTCSRFWAVTD